MAVRRPFQTQKESKETTFAIKSYVERRWIPFYEQDDNSEA